MSYKIVRFYLKHGRRTIETGLTLEQAQARTTDPDSSWKTCTTSAGRQRTKRMGPWFDGYMKEV